MIPAQTPAAPLTIAPVAPGTGQPSAASLQEVVLNQGVKDQICTLGRRFPIDRVVETIETNYQCKVSREQIRAVWAERYAPKTEAAPGPNEWRADKESVHPADAPRECLLTPPGASPEPAPSIATDAPPTRTGPGREKEAMQLPTVEMKEAAAQRMAPSDPPEPIADVASPNAQAGIDPAPVIADAVPADLQTERDHGMPPTGTAPAEETESHEILPDDVREFIIGCMARREPPWLVAKDVERDFGLVVDHDEIIVCWRDRDASPTSTRTGPGQEKESRPRLSDEVKEFIVKRLACYETPSRIAAAVRINFGIDVDRRRVFEYNPAGSRPPAQRWIDLHAATRARFLCDAAEIGVAQKVIRLRMLDRFAEMAEDNNRHDKAAKYLEQAARECGGFYERFQRPKAAAVVAVEAGATD
jgi:hypothetical protein